MSDSQRLIARAYRDAGAFRRYWAKELAEAGRQLIAPLDLRDARRVLDLGAGIGVNVPRLHEAAPGALVVAADYVEEMIRAAPPSAARVRMDAQALGFADDTFDALVMAFMLFHVPDPSRALLEARRVLGPGGRIAVGTWFPAEPNAADDIWLSELDAHGAPAVPPEITHPAHMDSPEKIAGLLTDAGFADVETGTADFVDRISGVEEYLARRTAIGLSSARLETLPPDAQAEVIAAARAKLQRLEPEDFTITDRAILTRATRPG